MLSTPRNVPPRYRVVMAHLVIPAGSIDVLAVGEAVVDFISEHPADQLADVDTFRRYLGGSPANIAVHVSKLGGRAALIAKTGIGAFGTFIKGELRAAGVNTDHLVMDHRVHTSAVFVARTRGTPDFEALRAGDVQLEPADIPEEAVRAARIVHASTFALSRPPAREAVRRAFEIAVAAGRVTSLDPNFSPIVWPEMDEARSIVAEVLAHAMLSKPSLDDCHRLFGDRASPETYIERFHEMGPQVVVLTMGREGILWSEGGAPAFVPARPIDVVDATGAGDSFWAGFLVALLDGNPLGRCVLFAREVVEKKLTAAGVTPGKLDRDELYARLP